MMNLIEGERKRLEEDKYTKIKTEQRYMAANHRLMKQTG